MSTTCHAQTRPPSPPAPFFALLLLLISQERPFHLWAWGKGYLQPKASNVATQSKAFMPVARQGAGIYFPHPPVSSSRPLAPPRSLKEIHCPCFLSCLPLPELGKQYSTKLKKRELPVLLSVVQAKSAVYCTPPRESCFYAYRLLDREKS